jgi:Zn-dependent metalloprotease
MKTNLHRSNASHSPACACCSFLPPYIVSRLNESDDRTLRKIAFDTVQVDSTIRTRREINPGRIQGRAPMPGVGYRRKVFDMQEAMTPLPGTLRREEKDGPTGHPEVDQAFENAGLTYDFYKNVFGRESVDGAGFPLISSINFGIKVANAFWEGTQMIYGAGDGQFFLSFTRSLSIAVHEMSHGVISYSSNLAYSDESGALNESFCDVMGAVACQWHAKQNVDQADWTIGREVLGPAMGNIVGVRTFGADKAFENHAYFGTDPQPKHMRDYVRTADDHGGVHTNSGIPNHAFYLAAHALGGNSWEQTARIWYEAFTKQLNPNATFVNAATTTSVVARTLFDVSTAEKISEAWRTVGVESEV